MLKNDGLVLMKLALLLSGVLLLFSSTGLALAPPSVFQWKQVVAGRFLLNGQTGELRPGPAFGFRAHNRYVTIRHPETDWNKKGRLQGATDIPLSHRGKRQSKRALQRLYAILADEIASGKPPIIYTSRLQRARAMAQMFIELVKKKTGMTLQIQELDELREIGRGDWEGKTKSEIEAKDPQTFEAFYSESNYLVKPSGDSSESLLELLQRIHRVYEEWERRHTGQTILLFGHNASHAALQLVLGDSRYLDSSGRLNFRRVRIGLAEFRFYPEVTDSLADLPEEVRSIVLQCSSVDSLERWLRSVISSSLNFGGKLSPKALSTLETLALVFGFESKPDKGILESLGSKVKNMQVSDADKKLIWDTFYNPERYESGEAYEEGDMWEQIQMRVLRLFGEVQPREGYQIFWRIKQYKSLLLKLERIVSQMEGQATPRKSSSTRSLIARARRNRATIASDPMAHFDDILGFNFVIDDEGLDEAKRAEILTRYSEQVEALLRSEPKTRVIKIRKQSRVSGYEAVNLFVQGWLNHRDFGALPIKIQFRFKTALYREATMYYNYKTYGRWEMPPWAKEIPFDQLKSFHEVQEMLFRNFKAYIARWPAPRNFSIFGHLKLTHTGEILFWRELQLPPASVQELLERAA